MNEELIQLVKEQDDKFIKLFKAQDDKFTRLYQKQEEYIDRMEHAISKASKEDLRRELSKMVSKEDLNRMASKEEMYKEFHAETHRVIKIIFAAGLIVSAVYFILTYFK